jgi:hypothetical protein
MKAKTINEIKFERGQDPLDAMSVGLGPFKYVDTFEKALKEFENAADPFESDIFVTIKKTSSSFKHVIFNKKIRPSFIEWEIRFSNKHFDVYVMDKNRQDELYGWLCNDANIKDAPNPFGIIEYIKKEINNQ